MNKDMLTPKQLGVIQYADDNPRAYAEELFHIVSDLTDRLASEQLRRESAEEVMLTYRNEAPNAQLAYMDYCGKYLGEPSEG